MCAKTVVKGALLGGITLFVVMMISWMALPFHMQSFHKLPNPEASVTAIQSMATEGSGVYIAPCSEDHPELASRLPFVFMSFNAKGAMQRNMAQYMMIEFAMDVVMAGLLTILLLGLKPGSPKAVAGYGLAIGAMLAIAELVPQWNWWYFPLEFLWPTALDLIIGFAIAALVVGKFVVCSYLKNQPKTV